MAIGTMSRLLTFSAFFLILISHTSSHSINRHHKTRLRDQSSANKVSQDTGILLESHKKTYNYPRMYHKNNPSRKLFEKYIVKETDQSGLSTSCGKITCDTVKNYPIDLIKRAYFEAKRNKYLPVPTEIEFTKSYNTPLLARNNPSISFEEIDKRRNPFTLENDSTDLQSIINSIQSRRMPSSFGYKQKRPNCKNQVKKTFPKEARNANHEPTLLVSLPKEYVPRGLECIADKYCKDDHTPENYVNYCWTKTKMENILTFNKVLNTVESQSVEMTDGCECKQVREEFLTL